MKRTLLLIILCTLHIGVAQETGEINFENLEIPNTPAFILLDEAPTSIQRPNSTRAFALDLLQNLKDDGVLDNIAVEVTPFWMIQHTKMSPEKFYGIKTDTESKLTRQNPFAKLRLASVSAAYIKSADSILNMSIGARATIFEIKRKNDVEAYRSVLNETQQFLSNTFNYFEEYTEFCKVPKAENYDDLASYQTALSEFNKACASQPAKPDAPITDEKREAYKEAMKTYRITCYCMQPERGDFGTDFEYDAAMKKFNSDRDAYISKREKESGFDLDAFDARFQEIVNRKPVFAVDLAVAYNQRFYGNTFNDNSAGRFGVWSTLTFNAFLDSKPLHTDFLNIYGFVRYLDDTARGVIPGASDDRFNAFDIGIKGELEFKKLIVGYEYIDRSGDMEGYRSTGVIQYKLVDDFYLTGSFGNNFSETNDIVTVFGIKWGINSALQNIIIDAVEE